MLHAEHPRPARHVSCVGLVCAGLMLWIAGVAPHDANAATPRRKHTRTPALPPEGPAPRFDLPIARAPLDTPLVVTGGFGEYRIGHFHAGFDFSTGGVTGKQVYAPLAGHIERVRMSGVGYGRSLYLRTNDGRTIQFGHLDAFVEPIASWVRAIQDSTGQYEQDLWPEPTRLPVRLGQPIAWTGQSGAGGPHLHFEIRRGDMAYHPMRAGLRARDESAPILVSLTLEPLTPGSKVEGSFAPVTIRLGARPETLTVSGEVRAVVGSRDGVWQGVDRMVPWLTRMEWDGQWIEARFDSVSWATDMVEGDYVYDTGRVVGEKGLVLWAPAGWRPRVIRTSVPLDQEAGRIVMSRSLQTKSGAMATQDTVAPKTLVLSARDAAGNRTETRVVLRSADTRSMLSATLPETMKTAPAKTAPPSPRESPAPTTVETARFELSSLPYQKVRIAVSGVPPESHSVYVGFADAHGSRWQEATLRAGVWSAVVDTWGGQVIAGGMDRRDRPWVARGPVCVARLVNGPNPDSSTTDFRWQLPPDALFDPEVTFLEEGGQAPPPGAELELIWSGNRLLPETMPLRKPVVVTMSHIDLRGRRHFGLFENSGGDWEWVASTIDSAAGVVRGESRRLGWFAVMSDTLAPRIGAPVSAGSRSGPYPRWAIEASLEERGSGVDARASWIEWDGKREPSEWDPEAGVLRWRPAARPPAGEHRIDVVASDRAGNVRRRVATLVLD